MLISKMEASNEVRVCFSLIMKNESRVLPRLFNNVLPFIKQFNGAVSILDNGSTDNSITIARNLMKKDNIPGEIISRPWLYFGKTRTEELRHSENVVFLVDKGALGVAGEIINDDVAHTNQWLNLDKPKGPLTVSQYKQHKEVITDPFNDDYNASSFLSYALDTHKDYKLKSKWYFVFMDIDDTLVFNVPIEKIKFNEERINVRIAKNGNHEFDYSNNLMVIVDPNRRCTWHEDLHEYLGAPSNSNFTYKEISEIKQNSGNDGSRSSDPLKFLNDALVLEKALIKNPNNYRCRYYLAQSYKDAKKYHDAINSYKMVAENTSADVEHRYMSFFHIGEIYKQLRSMNKKMYTGKSLKYYLKAHNVMPERREAPFWIASHFSEKGEKRNAWLFLDKTLSTNKTAFKLITYRKISEFWIYNLGAGFCADFGDYNRAFFLYNMSLMYKDINDEEKKLVQAKLDEVRKHIEPLVVKPAAS